MTAPSALHQFLFVESGQLRAIWRLAIFCGTAYSAITLFTLVGAVVIASVSPGSAFGWLSSAVALLAMALGLLAAHWLCLRLVDGQSWSFAGLHGGAWRPTPLVISALGGAFAIGLPTAALWITGQLSLVPAPEGSWTQATLRTSAVLIPAALWEELAFRGYPLAVLREAIGWRAALILTSLAFGAVHLANLGANPLNFVIVVMAGMLLGLIWLLTQSLYAAWIAHLAWNWVMACLFHVRVSGNPFEQPDYQLVSQGPDWLTGGIWGPEGGAAAAVGLCAAVVYVYQRYVAQHVAQQSGNLNT